jgi:16S rRNA (guanine527-N7)-methyltransferase
VTGAHDPALARLDLPEGVAARLGAYLDLLAAWNIRVNLTAVSGPEARVERLVAEVLPALPWIEGGSLLDIGSGNGSPGLVLAVLRPGVRATLLEPRGKRWAFLREAARAVGRTDIDILRLRHDQYRGRPAATATLRALALPLGSLGGVVDPGGRLLVFGGTPRPEPPFSIEADAPLAHSRLHVFRRDRST